MSGEVRIGPQPAGAARAQRQLGLVSQRPAVLPWKRAIDDVVFTEVPEDPHTYDVTLAVAKEDAETARRSRLVPNVVVRSLM